VAEQLFEAAVLLGVGMLVQSACSFEIFDAEGTDARQQISKLLSKLLLKQLSTSTLIKINVKN